jgi:hypothetical protein
MANIASAPQGALACSHAFVEGTQTMLDTYSNNNEFRGLPIIAEGMPVANGAGTKHEKIRSSRFFRLDECQFRDSAAELMLLFSFFFHVARWSMANLRGC